MVFVLYYNGASHNPFGFWLSRSSLQKLPENRQRYVAYFAVGKYAYLNAHDLADDRTGLIP